MAVEVSSPQDTENMATQVLAGEIDDSTFPDPDGCSLMKNFPSACPPIIISGGAFCFGGISKTLHLTHEVFRERIRSKGDAEIISPNNKYIENNYESILDMQLMENSLLGPINLYTSFKKKENSGEQAKEPDVVAEIPDALIPPAPVGTEKSDVEYKSMPAVPSPPTTEPPSPDQVAVTDLEPPILKTIVNESLESKDSELPPNNVLEVEHMEENKEEVVIPQAVSPEPPVPAVQKRTWKSKPMPLSVKRNRQVLPEISDDQPVAPSVYLDFNPVNPSYVKLIRLTESQVQRAARKRAQSSSEKSASGEGSINLRKRGNAEIPLKKRRNAKSHTICQMLSRSASLDDDYGDDECSSSEILDKSKSRTDSPQKNENSPPNPPVTPSPSEEQPSHPAKIQEFDIFAVQRPQKKPSNYRDKYNRSISLPEGDRYGNGKEKNNPQNTESHGEKRPSRNLNNRNGSPTHGWRTTSSKGASKKPVSSPKQADSSTSNLSRVRKSYGPASVNGHEALDKSKGNSLRPKTKRELDIERRKLRNQRNLANSANTGCFQITSDADNLKEYKIPKKNENVKRNNVRFFDEEKSNKGPTGKKAYPVEVGNRKPNNKTYIQTDINSKNSTAEKPSEHAQSKNGKLSDTESRSNTPDSDQAEQSKSSSGSSSPCIDDISRAPGEVDDSPPEQPDVVRFQIQGQEFVGNPEEMIAFDPWENSNLRISRPAESIQVLTNEACSETPDNSYYYTLAPGPTNESTQIVQVHVAEGDNSYFIMEEPGDHALECIGEVEVQTSSTEENRVPVIATVESIQTQSREVTTTTRSMLSLSEDDSPPPLVEASPPPQIEASPPPQEIDPEDERRDKAETGKKRVCSKRRCSSGSGSESGSCSGSCSSTASSSSTSTCSSDSD